jgi:hypothetical protein
MSVFGKVYDRIYWPVVRSYWYRVLFMEKVIMRLFTYISSFYLGVLLNV